MFSVLLFHREFAGADQIRHVLLLQACEAELTHVRTMSGFLAALEQWRFDVILLACSPSNSDHFAALAAARRWQPGTPIIALCGPADETEGRLSLREAADEYVPRDQLFRLAATIRRTAANGPSPPLSRPVSAPAS